MKTHEYEILVPDFSESVVQSKILSWKKELGDLIEQDETLVEVETDKVVLEIVSPKSGILKSILKDSGSLVRSGEIIGYILSDEDLESDIEVRDISLKRRYLRNLHKKVKNQKNEVFLSPSDRRRILKDREKYEEDDGKLFIKSTEMNEKDHLSEKKGYFPHEKSVQEKSSKYKIVPMTGIRRSISDRLLYSKNNSVTLTTFNEVNMGPVMNMRKMYGKEFERIHGLKLGMITFFIKACVISLKKYSKINASIDKNNILYHNHIDINVAISTDRGLVTPIIRRVEDLNLVEINHKIKGIVKKSTRNGLTIKDLESGSFTITNGGIFGSLMSTPVINPPQSAILGMHSIQKRAVIKNDKIKIFPMMYLALSYDHRIIDGKEAIEFLLNIKSILEDPILLLINQ
ncbi:dihydrolipoyllysine-residue succinyltransferase [Candidatus Riesia pediculischaeffi]|uniref:Dihydrolipoyllysine-residue succinyltransferase n=1 Tax=Candidatus Riesia pediculischaeffi TaxID=428411 RepID=A0A1V0HKK5_9ENTR|nr:dihydrolipoyllysine-residue succinyltransferase [Candidatus Riesia pediculischaeffi]ARC53356.1 dihydrolipoamide succinyltransferase [Candidatus Riesia pediculischaeffi]